jgi:curved DNA-binding protein CbpA
MRDYYNLLGVPSEAPPEAIRAAFRREAKACHPDAHPSAVPEARAGLERRFILLAQAYDTLSDPARRRDYDRLWRARFGPARAGAGSARPSAAAHGRGPAAEGARASGTHRPAGGPARGTGGRSGEAEPAWEDLLHDAEALLARFGLDLRQPFEQLLEALLDWARALFREVAGAWNAHEGPAGAAERKPGSASAHRTRRAQAQAPGGSGGQSTQPPGRSAPRSPRQADPEAIERELAELKRKAKRKD